MLELRERDHDAMTVMVMGRGGGSNVGRLRIERLVQRLPKLGRQQVNLDIGSLALPERLTHHLDATFELRLDDDISPKSAQVFHVTGCGGTRHDVQSWVE